MSIEKQTLATNRINIDRTLSPPSNSTKVSRDPDPMATDSMHTEISTEALSMANKIYSAWSGKEESENGDRRRFIKDFFRFLKVQWWVSIILIVLSSTSTSVDTPTWLRWLGNINITDTIFISFFSSIIIQSIGVMIVIAKYLYNERDAKILDVIEKIISVAGKNNTDYKEKSD